MAAPLSISRPGPGTPQTVRVDWRGWMRALGGQARRAREFLGLSQLQLSTLAAVSQGSVSRFEAGRGLATPLLVAVKIYLALVRELRRLEPDMLGQQFRRLLELEPWVAPAVEDPGIEASPPTVDSVLAEIVRLYRGVSDRQRETLLTVVRATVAALVATHTAAAPPAQGSQQRM